HGVAGGGGLSAGGAGAGRARAARQPAADPARLAPAAACLAGPAVLGNAGRGRVARGDAVAAGAGAAPARTARLAARAAAAGGAGNLAVPHHQGRLRAAKRDPADRRAVRPRPAGPAPGPQDRAECALLGGVRGAAGRAVALWLAGADGGALDPGGDGAAGAGVLRVEVCVGGGAGEPVRGCVVVWDSAHYAAGAAIAPYGGCRAQ